MAGNGKTCYFPDEGAGGWQTTEKSTMKRGVFGTAVPAFLFLTNRKTGEYTMDKSIDFRSCTFSEAIEEMIDKI